MSQHDEVRNINTRRRNLLFLIQRFLQDNALTDTAKLLATEAHLAEQFELCDNVDLDSIYLDYASYHHLKFGKYPRIVRKIQETNVKVSLAKKPQKKKLPTIKNDQETKQEGIIENYIPELQVTVKNLETSEHTAEIPKDKPTTELVRLQEIEHNEAFVATGDFMHSCNDWQALMELVKSTIFREDFKLTWLDMCGNYNCKEIIKEAVLAPIKFPQLFSNGLKPWRSVLLHGPPGSGKTLLAKILYSETRNHVTFFNVSSSVIVSKWRGESEKILRVLFYMARRQAPSIIFLDEIEGLTSRRDRPVDHESSKRFKNELLQLLDGMEQQVHGVFVLASTNLPWEIDEAFLRRFEKKLLVELPNAMERAQLIGKLLPISIKLSSEQMETMVRLSDQFTGDEIRLACKEISMQAVRHIICANKDKSENSEILFEQAFKHIKPLSLKLFMKHEQWQKEYGS